MLHACIESEGPPGDGPDTAQDMNGSGYEGSERADEGSSAPPKAEFISLPTEGGGFKAYDFVGPEIAALCSADPHVMVEPWLAELLAGGTKSGARVDPKEYDEIIQRLLSAKLAELTAERAAHLLGMFAVWNEVDAAPYHRWTASGRVFASPLFEFTCGEDCRACR